MTQEFKLLSRDAFRNGVFERDKFKCLFCNNPAKDAHHIIERRLFPDGGYYLENGASLCEDHHIQAEQTTLSCNDIREKIGITKFPIPPHLYRDQDYDKWGNPILPNGSRIKGDLFEDESVQKILSPVLHLFTNKVKYPRTYHLPWSPGVNKDDRVKDNVNEFIDTEVVVTIKMDGENTSMYSNYIHARSIDFSNHPSRSWVKALHNRIAYEIPEGWRICGENLFAKHSIQYDNLEDYFLVFSIWNERNVCLNWQETVEISDMLNLKYVPVLYKGIYDQKLIQKLYEEYDDGNTEGYVIRISDSFHYKNFKNCVGKYVRKNHVQTHGHWMRSKLIKNNIKE